jgi:hypothetical protein
MLLTASATTVAVAAVAWILDFAVFELRAGAKWNPYGSITVTHYYAVEQKSGKTRFIFDPPAAQTCVNALFPHSGSKPCWYLSRHPEQRTDI